MEFAGHLTLQTLFPGFLSLELRFFFVLLVIFKQVKRLSRIEIYKQRRREK